MNEGAEMIGLLSGVNGCFRVVEGMERVRIGVAVRLGGWVWGLEGVGGGLGVEEWNN